MKIGYVDTSALLGVAFGEPRARPIASRLRSFERLISSNLLEAEFRSALHREGIRADGGRLLSLITWIYPNRPLTQEYESILELGHLRGADLWHLACALLVDHGARGISFLTLDPPQKELARKLGFTV